MAANESSTPPWEQLRRQPSFALEQATGFLDACTDKFGHLEAILISLRDRLPEGCHERKLADAGIAIAGDMENYADCWREDTEAAAKAAKVFTGQNLQVAP